MTSEDKEEEKRSVELKAHLHGVSGKIRESSG